MYTRGKNKAEQGAVATKKPGRNPITEAMARAMLRDVNCPGCGKLLRAPRGKASIHCKHCGTRWIQPD